MNTNYISPSFQLNKYIKACGSNFAAIMYVSKVARKLRKRVDHCISESEALSWAVTGVTPDKVKYWRKHRYERRDESLELLLDRLCYVDDVDVRDAVYTSITSSQTKPYLVYKYNKVQDSNRQARIRILSNMIWDEIQLLKLNNMV